MALYKNVASQKLAVYAHDTSADAAKTGDAAQITAQISKDGGATAATDDTNPTELDAADAPGIYLFDLTQAETNADLVIVCAVSSTADISLEPVIIYTLPGSNAGVSADAVAISGDSTAADNLESACDGGAYNVGGGAVVAASVTGAVGSVTGAVGSVTGAVGSVAAGVTLANDAIKAVTFDETTAWPLTAADTGATAVARTGADADTLETLSDQLDAVETDTGEIGAAGAGLTDVPWNSSWDAEVQSECADALTAYDPPTNAEMEARTIAAASYFDPAADTVDVGAINGSTAAAARLALSAAQIIPGTVSAAVGAPSTTVFYSDDITEATADHYNGRLVVWTTGNLAGQVTDVTDYALDTGEGKFTVTAMTEAPADNDTFILV